MFLRTMVDVGILWIPRGVWLLKRDGHWTSDAIDEQIFEENHHLADQQAVDLMIRTGGEHRISNFLLWQSAYAELVFSDVLWPDFGGESLDACLSDYAGRERRFGKTSEQVRG